MRSLTTLALAALALASPITIDHDTSPNPAAELARRAIPNGTGTSNGFFYSVYAESGIQGSYTNGAAGAYTLQWSGNGDVVVGKGWQTGAARAIKYTADYQCNGNCYLAVYGWLTDPLVEYYVVENYGSYNPGSGGQQIGTVTADGSVYDIVVQTRTNAPSIIGTATFKQYWSIRRNKRTAGTVSTGLHFDAWKKAGLQLGKFNYQIMATEGYSSSGKSTVTVS